MSVWENLSKIDCNEHKKQKGKLSYLSWTWAWAATKNEYPNAVYSFREPVFFADGTCEVWVTVTIEELSHDMWLPVMDNRNNSLANPTSRDISDTRMRCLTKCLAMFGLGHYIYAGEDLPDAEKVIIDGKALKAKYDAAEDATAMWESFSQAEQSAVLAEQG